MKSGIYKEIFDPQGHYGELLEQITVSPDTPNELKVHMDKIFLLE
jgi:hypothetical protein